MSVFNCYLQLDMDKKLRFISSPVINQGENQTTRIHIITPDGISGYNYSLEFDCGEQKFATQNLSTTVDATYGSVLYYDLINGITSSRGRVYVQVIARSTSDNTVKFKSVKEAEASFEVNPAVGAEVSPSIVSDLNDAVITGLQNLQTLTESLEEAIEEATEATETCNSVSQQLLEDKENDLFKGDKGDTGDTGDEYLVYKYPRVVGTTPTTSSSFTVNYATLNRTPKAGDYMFAVVSSSQTGQKWLTLNYCQSAVGSTATFAISAIVDVTGEKGDKGDKGDTGYGTASYNVVTNTQSGEVEISISPNLFYNFTGEFTSLSVLLDNAVSGIVNEYMLQFTTGATAPDLFEAIVTDSYANLTVNGNVSATIDKNTYEDALGRSTFARTAYYFDRCSINTSNSSLSVTVDKSVFSSAISQSGSYQFDYSSADSTWKYSGNAVSLSTYGITVVGTPENANYLVVHYYAPGWRYSTTSSAVIRNMSSDGITISGTPTDGDTIVIDYVQPVFAKWVNFPTITSNTTYQVSIINGIGVIIGGTLT